MEPSLAEKIATKTFDVEQIRKQFPILHQNVNGYPLVYFDNAATTQKPQQVIDALVNYYSGFNANIHRGIHTLAERATEAFEDTRRKIKQFINSAEAEEIIFTRGCTEGINIVAGTYGRANIKEGDEIIISSMEHHSNIVPWQILCEEKKAKLKVIPIDENGDIIFEEFEKLLSDRTKIVSLVYASNALGTINPVEEIIRLAHQKGAVVVLDAAQAAPHLVLDVQKLDCDFLAFSGHKVYGPTGTGALYGKRQLLEAMPPYQGGGEMIKEVTFEKTSYAEIPYKFEAGTPNIADIVALKAALDFVDSVGKSKIATHENQLLAYLSEKLQGVDRVRLIGTAKKKVSVQSFILEGIHHLDIAMMLDARGIAVRTGHHCTQPLMNLCGIDGTVRASFAVYNTKQEIDNLIDGLNKIVSKMK